MDTINKFLTDKKRKFNIKQFDSKKSFFQGIADWWKRINTDKLISEKELFSYISSAEVKEERKEEMGEYKRIIKLIEKKMDSKSSKLDVKYKSYLAGDYSNYYLVDLGMVTLSAGPYLWFIASAIEWKSNNSDIKSGFNYSGKTEIEIYYREN